MKRSRLLPGLLILSAGVALIVWQFTHRPVRQGDDTGEVVCIGHIFMETQAAVDAVARAKSGAATARLLRRTLREYPAPR